MMWSNDLKFSICCKSEAILHGAYSAYHMLHISTRSSSQKTASPKTFEIKTVPIFIKHEFDTSSTSIYLYIIWMDQGKDNGIRIDLTEVVSIQLCP